MSNPVVYVDQESEGHSGVLTQEKGCCCAAGHCVLCVCTFLHYQSNPIIANTLEISSREARTPLGSRWHLDSAVSFFWKPWKHRKGDCHNGCYTADLHTDTCVCTHRKLSDAATAFLHAGDDGFTSTNQNYFSACSSCTHARTWLRAHAKSPAHTPMLDMTLISLSHGTQIITLPPPPHTHTHTLYSNS